MSKGDFNEFNMDLARVNQLSQKMKLTRRKPNQNCGIIVVIYVNQISW